MKASSLFSLPSIKKRVYYHHAVMSGLPASVCKCYIHACSKLRFLIRFPLELWQKSTGFYIFTEY